MFLKKQWCRIGEEVKPQKFGIRQVDEGQLCDNDSTKFGMIEAFVLNG